MAIYRYRAKTKSGETVAGTVDVHDRPQAVAALREQALFVLEVRPERAVSLTGGNPLLLVKNYVINPLFAGAATVDLAAFFRHMQKMIAAGVNLVDAMSALSEMRSSGRLRKIAVEMLAWMRDGRLMSDGLRRYPWMFSESQIRIIEAGEASGTLESAFTRLAEYVEWELKVRQRLRMATFYPKLLVVCTIFIPKIGQLVFGNPLAYFVSTGMGLVRVLIILAVIWGLHRLLIQSHGVRLSIDHSKLTIPKIGPMVRVIALSKFYKGFALMYASGIPLAQGLDLAASSMGNEYLASKIRTALPMIRNGQSIGRALLQTRVMPNDAFGLLSVGETTGDVGDALAKLAEHAEQDAEYVVAKNTMFVGTLLTFLVGAYIVIMYLGAVAQISMPRVSP